MPPAKRCVLRLADGFMLEGVAVGAQGTVTGELCYNTGQTGYYEIFTDPSYAGQIIVMTHVHIGVYGAKESERQSNGIQIAGLVCHDFAHTYSRRPEAGALDERLRAEGKVGITGVDTRALVLRIRAAGAMNAVISSEIFETTALDARLAAAPAMDGQELASAVSTPIFYAAGAPDAKRRVALLDYGVKREIIASLARRDCYVGVFPAKTEVAELLAFQPDGFLLSNGPGDPAAMDYAVRTVQALLAFDKPIFGICLGHQILGLAVGAKTYKMFYGHRGVNHPVKNLETGLCEITSQNHGFALQNDGLPENVIPTHLNLNDGSIEGIKVRDKNAFSVQYHPEAAPGPHDSRYLFDKFVALMKEN